METLVIRSIKEDIVKLEELIQTIKDLQKEFPADKGLNFSRKQYEGLKLRREDELRRAVAFAFKFEV